jgi:PKD repeat protein
MPAGTPNSPPVANVSAAPNSGVAPLSVVFSSAGSSDPDGSIASYSWNFGDGSALSGSASPTHIYQNPGNYTAVLTVTDNRGATGTAQTAIVVSVNPNALNAPSALTAAGGNGKATLQWTDNASNETGFYIERAPSGGSSFIRVGSVGTNVKTFVDSVNRGTYLYRVQAFNAAAVSVYSNTATARVK